MSDIHQTSETERLRIKEAHGALVDQYGRDAERCESAARRTAERSSEIRELIADVRSTRIVLGRLTGDRLLQRLERSAEVLDRIAARDTSFAADLGAADNARLAHIRAGERHGSPAMEPAL